MLTCDCGATPEETAAGIHNQPCTSHDSEPDTPADHYRQ